MIGQMAIPKALLGFHDLWDVRWPLFFFSKTDFIHNYLHIVQKWTKKSMWEGKINPRFLSTGHPLVPSCGCKACKTVVAKCKLVLWRTSPVDNIHLIGPFKPYLAENIFLQSSNRIFAAFLPWNRLPEFFCVSRSLSSRKNWRHFAAALRCCPTRVCWPAIHGFSSFSVCLLRVLRSTTGRRTCFQLLCRLFLFLKF